MKKAEKEGCTILAVLAFVILVPIVAWKGCSSFVGKISESTPDAALERVSEDPGKQAQRGQFINQMIGEGIFRKVDYTRSGATAWVDSGFYALTFEQKRDFCSVIYAYVSRNGEDQTAGVILKDALSGNTVGDYGQQWTGVGLKMK